MSDKIICPCCGEEITAAVMSQIGKRTSAKKAASSRANAIKALEGQLASYTTEKRKEAAKKAWEKRRANAANK